MVELELAQRGSVRRQAVGDDRLRLHRLVAQEALQKRQSCVVIPPLLHHDVQHLALVVDRAPEVHPLAADAADHFVQVPTGRRRRAFAFQVTGDLRAELDRPAADGLVADIDAARRQHLLNVPKAEGEAEVKPHRVPDHVRGKAMTLERERLHRKSSPISRLLRSSVETS